MADYYTHFSTLVAATTVPQQYWWTFACKTLDEYSGQEIGTELENLHPDVQIILKAALLDDTVHWGVQCRIDTSAGTVWLSDEDGAPNLDAVAGLIQLYYRTLEMSNSIHTFCWAETCSKPRIDAFGGGVVAITANEIKWLNVSAAATTAIRSFEEYGTIEFFLDE